MGKIITQTINDFSLGMTSDPRTSDSRYSRLIKNFDAHTYKHKLVPLRDSEDGDAGASTSKKVNFLYANGRLYGLGVVSGGSLAEINFKTDYTNNSWSAPSNNASSSGAKADEFFVVYKNYIYGARAGTNLWRHGDITGSPTWTDSWQSLSYTNIAQGLVHSKDDILYIPYDNKIAKWDNSSFTAAALTLPSDKIITSICEYGNYLAIGCRPSSGYGVSVVYLWDRDSTVSTLSESIDWGEGSLRVLEQVDGVLVGISHSTTNGFADKITFRQYNGGVPSVFLQFVSETTNTNGGLSQAKQKINNTLYFLLKIKLDGTTHEGVWKVGRTGPGLPFSVVLDRTPTNDTALTSSTLNGFFFVGDYLFISYISSHVSANVYYLSKTNDSASYTATSVYDSFIIKNDDSSQTKQLLGVTAMHEALPSAGQIVIKYKKDEETSFSTLKTNTTDNSMRTTAINDANKNTLPKFKELTIRVESTGGAVLTGLKCKYQEINDDGY